MSGGEAVVFAGAPVHATPRLLKRVADLRAPLVVAADSGAASCAAFGLRPDVLVGDLDSIDEETLRAVRDARVTIDVHPRDKDATDGELAVAKALGLGAEHVLLLGYVGGDRLDQTLANVLLLTRLPGGVEILDERNACWLLRDGEAREWTSEAGEVVSLIPVGGDAAGVATAGLRWQLEGAALALGSTRGVSNEPVAERCPVRVAVSAGMLLVARHFPPDGSR